MPLKPSYLVAVEAGVPPKISEYCYVGARLEPRCRSENAVEQGLEARIADPLWMLARQWQMGEFQAEDSGSPIRVQVSYRTEHVDRVLLPPGSDVSYIDVRTPIPFNQPEGKSPSPPLETVIEREPIVRDWRLRVQMGQQFERFIRRALSDGADPPKANQVICFYRKPAYFGLKIPKELRDIDYATQRFLSMMQGRVIDGSAALDAYVKGAVPRLPSGFVVDSTKLTQAFEDLKNWFAQLYSEPTSGQKAFWKPQELEYEFTLRKESVITGGNGSTYNIELSAPDYRNGDLDWYSCDVLSRSQPEFEKIPVPCKPLFPSPGPTRWIVKEIFAHIGREFDVMDTIGIIEDQKTHLIEKVPARHRGTVHEIHVEQFQIIEEGAAFLTLNKYYHEPSKVASFNPTRIGFAGKPNERWWAFEDYKVDLSRLNPNTSELAKLMFAEFALVYADDWYLVPLEVPLGTITSILYLKVENVFGESLYIPKAVREGSTARDRWELFTLSIAKNPEQGGLSYLFIPPSLGDREESPPIEEVRFIRDEGANMVFAIERTVTNGLGNPVEGFEAQLERHDRERRKNIEKLETQKKSIEEKLAKPGLTKTDQRALNSKAQELKTLIARERRQLSATKGDGLPRYRLASVVPDNWVPFVPQKAHKELSGKKGITEHSIRLRQAVMMRNENADKPSEITPLTRILNNKQNPEQSIDWLNEESVPRAGIKVQLTRQRVRWSNGKTYVWLGRKVKTGRGEGSSGLRFDMLMETAGGS
jgi:hypothetical protein